MKNIEAKIPEPVLKQAEEFADREKIPLVQLHAKHASKEDFLKALD